MSINKIITNFFVFQAMLLVGFPFFGEAASFDNVLLSTNPHPARFPLLQWAPFGMEIFTTGTGQAAVAIDGKPMDSPQGLNWSHCDSYSGCPAGATEKGLFYPPMDVVVGEHKIQLYDLERYTASKELVFSNALPFTIFRTEAEAVFPEDPTVLYISPASGKPGDTVTIYGTNFKSDSYIVFDPEDSSPEYTGLGTKVTPVSRTPTSMTFIVPARTNATTWGGLAPKSDVTASHGIHRVGVRPAKISQAVQFMNYNRVQNIVLHNNTVNFNIVESVTSSTPQASSISSVNPSRVPQGGTIILNGSGFRPGSKATIDGFVSERGNWWYKAVSFDKFLPSSQIPVSAFNDSWSSSSGDMYTVKIPLNLSVGRHLVQVKGPENRANALDGFMSNPIWITVTPEGTTPGTAIGYPEITPSPIILSPVVESPSVPAAAIIPTPAPVNPTLVQVNPALASPSLLTTPAQEALESQVKFLLAKIASMQNEGKPREIVMQTPATAPPSACTRLSKNLSYKSSDTKTEGQVTSFQQFLMNDGYLATASSGYFGSATLKATKAFQKTEGINPTGYVGPLTRAKIQALSCE